MYGILWSKQDCESALTMAGSSYSTLEVYLEELYKASWYHEHGYSPSIVSVHWEDGQWIC